MFTDPKTGYHKHKCEKCVKSVIWEHPVPPEELDEDMVNRAHTCPVCGEEEWYKYGGKEKVTHPFTGWENLPQAKESGIGGTGTKNKTKCNRNCKNCQFSSIDKLIDQILLSFD